jgi:heat-inducible transcriptional repressor
MLSNAPLSSREHDVLHQIVHRFVQSAVPVASKTLAQGDGFAVSPATIRNAMSALEQKGYLEHPHTSAGRVPTQLGYRYFVDSLLTIPSLTSYEQSALDALSGPLPDSIDHAVHEGARLLAKLSHTLAVVIAPKLSDAVFRSMDCVSLSSTRLLVVLTVDSGLLRTVTMEVRSDIQRSDLDRVTSVLNERLSGRRLSHIAQNIRLMLNEDVALDRTGLLRILIDRADMLFEDRRVRRIHVGGVEYLALHPEFTDLDRYKGLIECLEDQSTIVHLLEDHAPETQLSVKIGTEHQTPGLEECSMVSMPYSIGSNRGTIGLVGPKRMDYPRMMALVQQLASRFNQ